MLKGFIYHQNLYQIRENKTENKVASLSALTKNEPGTVLASLICSVCAVLEAIM